MICRVGGTRYAGRAVDVAAPVDPERVARAVRTGSAMATDPTIIVAGPDPGPLHERVGCIHAGCSLRPRTALASAGRSLGWETDVDEELRQVRTELAQLEEDPTVPTDPDARRRVAEAGDDVDRLRERVAAVRGRVGAADASDDVDVDLEDAIRSLSEVETTVAAAHERRRTTREAAREARDRLEVRLRLEDRRGNLERRARRALLERAREPYLAALAAVPGLDDVEDAFEAPADAMALAIARLGALRAPVVVAVDRFRDATDAADWLDAPVIHLEP